MGNVTTKDLAAICGVSRTTIQRALSGQGRINEDTRRMILKAAEDNDYRPDMLARSLVKGKSNYIGVVVIDINNRYFSQMVNSIGKQAHELGYIMNISLHGDDKLEEKRLVSNLASYHVDGILLSSVNKGNEYSSFINSLGIPVVTMNNKVTDDLPFVGIDERGAAENAVEMIAAENYNKIIFVCPPLSNRERKNVYVHEERLAGFKFAAMRHPKIKFRVIGHEDYYAESYHEIMEPGYHTAFFCTSDMYALNLIQYLNRYDRIPGHDYGIMGFDNIDTLKYVKPRLSTINNLSETVGQKAMSILSEMINGDETQQQIILPSELIKGETI